MSCQVQISATQGPLGEVKDETLTVGRPFVLNCDGDIGAEFDPKSTELRLDAESKYKLNLLQLEKIDGAHFKVKVVSYRPGEHKLQAVQLVDANHSVVLGDLQFTVASVLNPQKPETEPFGPMGPIVLPWPLWIWVSLVSILLGLVFIAGLIFWRIRRWRKWLAEVGNATRIGTPLVEFSREIRRIRKMLDSDSIAIAELKKIFINYISRTWVIPAHRLSKTKIENLLRKNLPSEFDLNVDLWHNIWREISSAEEREKNNDKLKVSEIVQIAELIRSWVDKMEFELQKSDVKERMPKWKM